MTALEQAELDFLAAHAAFAERMKLDLAGKLDKTPVDIAAKKFLSERRKANLSHGASALFDAIWRAEYRR